jgi:hypothetical protein
MRVTVEVPAHPRLIEALLEGLIATNMEMLDGGAFPPLYEAGVQYQREPRGSEDWQTCERTMRRGVGDCEDLTGWRVAELRRAGERGARPFVRPARGIGAGVGGRRRRRRGRRKWHVLVERADGSFEDPSLILGMGRNR